MKSTTKRLFVTHKFMSINLLICVIAASISAGTMQVEKLNRGLIAIRKGSGYYLSWRLLANEDYYTGFNVYKENVKLNSSPVTGATVYTDANTPQQNEASTYTVRAIIDGVEQEASDPAILINSTEGANAGYLQIPLQRPPTGQHGGTYSPNDGSVGDLTGNEVYDIILKWEPSNAKDNSQNGLTDNVFIDAYTLTGTRLWRIDLGINIRAGAHYTQFMVYDFDGCGKAEIIMKTAPGTKDGTGNFIKMGPADTADHSADYRDMSIIASTGEINGRILSGPEYLTVFDGETGRELATTEYWPNRDPADGWGLASNGKPESGNRCDRFNAAVAYLDGERPSAVFQRGYYDRMTFAAWDWRNGQLTQRWTFNSGTSGSTGNAAYRHQGNHQLSVADVDNSGKHSIITGAAVIGPDGIGKHSKRYSNSDTTRYGHGDALHVAHMIKDHPTPQIFMAHETGSIGASLRHANNGETIFAINNSADVGRGVAAELDPVVPGFKFWRSNGIELHDIMGKVVGRVPNNGNNNNPNGNFSYNFVIWWSGALSRETLDGDKIAKWDITTNTGSRLLTANGTSSNNGSKSNPVLQADIFGDWREEVIFRTNTNDALRIYTTTMPTTHRLVTMMHDPVYRVAVAWQNSSYNQPPHPGYYIASDMEFPPSPLDVAVVDANSNPTAAIFNNRPAPMDFSLNISRAGKRSSFKINYYMKERGSVQLSLFDIKGNKVKTFVNSVKDRGEHREKFTAERLAAGLYVVKFKAGRQTLQRTLVLTK